MRKNPGLPPVCILGKWFALFFIYAVSGSKAMQKLSSAICGKRGKNLDDLEQMKGNIFACLYIWEKNWQLFVYRILPHLRHRISEQSPAKICQQNWPFWVNIKMIWIYYLQITCRWLGMLMRSCLAAIDFNENIERPQKVSAKGKQLFREKVKYMNGKYGYRQ